jgi:hypothetical protein
MIVAAAIQFPGKDCDLICFVPAPGRHHNVLHSLWHQFKEGKKDRTPQSYADEIQGFITDKGKFLDRLSAMRHAVECGQPMLRKPGIGYQGDELFSEDLW